MLLQMQVLGLAYELWKTHKGEHSHKWTTSKRRKVCASADLEQSQNFAIALGGNSAKIRTG